MQRAYLHIVKAGIPLTLSAVTFTKRYNVKILLWFESHDLVTDAIQRETSIKRWSRRWKIALIEKNNSDWNDFYERLG